MRTIVDEKGRIQNPEPEPMKSENSGYIPSYADFGILTDNAWRRVEKDHVSDTATIMSRAEAEFRGLTITQDKD